MRWLSRLLDRFWPMRRWECKACHRIWEQRAEPGYLPRFAPPGHFYRKHDVCVEVTKDGWLWAPGGGFRACGPIVYQARRAT